jgi:predicted amidohydrolase
MNTDQVRVAAVQFEPKQFEKKHNILELMRLVRQAAGTGSKLIVTPEMGTTGYCWYTREEVAPYVETIPGPTTGQFAELAKELETHIVVGLPEIDPATGLYYNSAVLIGPEGVIGIHRKTHSYISEPKWSAPGDLGHQVFETSIGRIALLICMDIRFIETARLVALAEADIICHISNWLAERTPAPYWISRAFENDCYLIESNRWGLERTVQFSGGSCVISPEGKIETVIDAGDGIGYAEIDLKNARLRKRSPHGPMLDRRPDCYTSWRKIATSGIRSIFLASMDTNHFLQGENRALQLDNSVRPIVLRITWPKLSRPLRPLRLREELTSSYFRNCR